MSTRPKRTAAVLALILSAVTAQARAQVVGDRVRITQTRSRLGATYTVLGARLKFTDKATDVGIIAGLSADTIFLVPDQSTDTVLIPARWITRFDVSRGTVSHFATDAGWGALIGVGTGALIGRISRRDCPHLSCTEGESLGSSLAPYVGGVVGTVLGAIAGGVIGAVTSGEKWEPATMDRWHLSLAPQPHGGLSLGLAIRF